MAGNSKGKRQNLIRGSTIPLRTKQQAAEYIQCTPRYLERMVHSGRLRALKPTGKLIRFRQSDLDKFLESGSTIGGDAL
jgi:excisionase family DNA binding protein